MEHKQVLSERIAVLEEVLQSCRQANEELARVLAMRKHSEEQLRKLTVAVEQSPVSVVITDREGRIEYVNPKFTQVTGYTLSEAIGQNPRVLKSGEQGPEVYAQLWQTITAGGEWRGEFHNKRKDGSLYWEIASISAIRNAAGEITHYLAVKEDITERKEAEAALSFAYAQLEELFNSSPDASVLIGTDYTIKLINNTMATMLEVDKGDVIGRNCYEVLQNNLCGTENCPVTRITAGEERIEEDVTLSFAQGKSIPCLFTAVPYRPAGKFLGVFEILKDMTERKRAEEALRKDFQLGAQIQREFVPKPFTNGLVRLDVIYEPYNYVSGDLCDCFWINNSKLFGFVLDVMGHGLATALQTSALRVLFHQAAKRDGSLAEKMQWLNQASMPYFAEDSFAGAICFEMDFKTMTLTYVSAGINFFLAGNSMLRGVITLPGPFLGIMELPYFEAHTVSMNYGDTWYFVSDGLFDLLDDSVTANVNHYEATLAALREKALSSRRWDDATALCLQINAKPVWPFVEYYSTKQEFQQSRNRLRHILQQVAGEQGLMLEVGVNEGANNAVRAAAEAKRPFSVRLKINRIGNRLIIRIKDSGDGFNGNAAVAAGDGAGCDWFEQAMLAESGRGIMIMKALFQKVIYNRKGNEVLLAKDLRLPICRQ